MIARSGALGVAIGKLRMYWSLGRTEPFSAGGKPPLRVPAVEPGVQHGEQVELGGRQHPDRRIGDQLAVEIEGARRLGLDVLVEQPWRPRLHERTDRILQLEPAVRARLATRPGRVPGARPGLERGAKSREVLEDGGELGERGPAIDEQDPSARPRWATSCADRGP